MYKNKKVSVVIPTYNEAQSIKGVIDGFFDTGLVDEVIAVDNNALGNTKEEIKKTKAVYIQENKNQGYGHALMRGIKESTGDIVVMCEADGTFQPKDIEKLLSYSDEFEAVLGTRTSRSTIWSGAFMPFPVRFGNWLWAKFIEILFNGPVLTDVGCTYKLLSREALEKIKPLFPLSDGGGKFSPELMIWLIQTNVSLIEVPVIYKERVGQSMYTGSILKAAKLGFKMLPLILKYKFKKYKIETIALVITAITALLNLFFSSLTYSTDDQFILFRYIDNIATGQGFVYNLGERVLGATTPLFTLLVALFKYLFISVPTPLLVASLNIVFLSVASVFFYRVCRNLLSEELSFLGVVVFALSMFKTIPEGMESPLFILTLFIFLDFIFRGKYYWSAIFLALTILTRPDAGLVAILATIFWWQRLGWVKTIRLIVVCVTVTLPWLIFSTLYFGSFIPQSLVTKSHINEIVNQSAFQAFKVQLSSLSRIYWGKIIDPDNIPVQILVNLLPLLSLVYFGIRDKFNKNNWIIFIIPILYFIFFSLSNPVMWPWYLSQTEPLWILLSMVGVSVIWQKFKIPHLKILLVALIVIGPAFFWFQRVTTANLLNEGGVNKEEVGINYYLRDNVKPGEKIGVNNIGGLGYITNAYIVDFFGLTNDYADSFYPIESECTDKSRQYSVPPNLIIFTRPDWLVIGEGELEKCFMDGRWFKTNYAPVSIDGAPSRVLWKLKK